MQFFFAILQNDLSTSLPSDGVKEDFKKQIKEQKDEIHSRNRNQLTC